MGIENKQTAVEFLAEQYIQHSGNLIKMKKAFEQAEKMEKKQIIKTAKQMHKKGFHDCIDSINTGKSFCHKEEAKQYYYKTYGNDK